MIGADPFTLEIVREKLTAAADEMGVVLARSSMSPIVYEVLDFACGITDAAARIVAQTNGLTLFTGTFGPQIEGVLAKFGLDGMRDGDVFATNIPYNGGTHTCDVCLIRPIVVASSVKQPPVSAPFAFPPTIVRSVCPGRSGFVSTGFVTVPIGPLSNSAFR